MKFRGSRLLQPALLAVVTLCLTLPILADDRGEGPLDPSQPQGTTVDEIIQKFSAKEKQFRTRARAVYVHPGCYGADARR